MRRVVTLLCVVSAVGESQIVRDSAGVRLVAYPANAPAPVVWTVSDAPTFVSGGGAASGPAEFARIMLVSRLSDGRVAVVNGTSSEIRYFAPDGRHLTTSGRAGRGPGEFDFVTAAFRTGDSIAVMDRALRLQLIGPDGKVSRTVQRQGIFPIGGLFPDGRILGTNLDPPGDTTGNRLVATFALSIEGREGGKVLPFTHVPAYDVVRTPSGFSPLMLGPVLRMASAGNRACEGYAERWEVRCHTLEGRLQTITRRLRRPRPLAEADKELWRDAYRAQLRARGRASPEQVEAAVRHFQFAEFQSAFGRFLSGPDGELWVSDFQPAEDVALQVNQSATPAGMATWSVLARDGRWIADVRLPKRFALMDAGRDYVAGIDRDADDLERVVIYRLGRR